MYVDLCFCYSVLGETLMKLLEFHLLISFIWSLVNITIMKKERHGLTFRVECFTRQCLSILIKIWVMKRQQMLLRNCKMHMR